MELSLQRLLAHRCCHATQLRHSRSSSPSFLQSPCHSSCQTLCHHHITTNGPPVSGRTCRPSPERLHIAQEEFTHLLELGIIRPSASCWSSPLHMVPKIFHVTGVPVGTIGPLIIALFLTGTSYSPHSRSQISLQGTRILSKIDLVYTGLSPCPCHQYTAVTSKAIRTNMHHVQRIREGSWNSFTTAD